ncbi:MAG: UvrD-helicase domain-containing protein, partial [Candidatus Aenigmarchaeota archaeon]|nr:UvrD-helicase domain-containing protein [Candidatus Aenigmarchaeota archaeon]
MIGIDFIGNKKFWKVLKLTEKGGKEISNPVLYKKKLSFNFKETLTQITAKDRVLFEKFAEFLGYFNDEQKKAIISDNKHILCLAGAGSGKTTVLTKRIEY